MENKSCDAGKSIKIGGMTVKNRLVMAPMNTNYSNENGAVTPQMEEYFVRRARGGVGLIVLEAVSVSPDSKNHGVQPLLCDEKFIPAWSNIVDRIHSYGTKVSVEITHYGSEAVLPPRVSCSKIGRFGSETVKPLTLEEIAEIENSFVRSALCAKKAGVDAITLHGAHGYLIAQFLSPLYNKRTDRYGGALENRMRFLTEIISKCRAELGDRFPVMVRYSVSEFTAGGRDLEESVKIAALLEAAGVSAIDLSAGIPAAYIFTNPPYSIPGTRCFLAPYSAEVRKAVHIPVICANGIRTADDVDYMLNSGSADMAALGRTLIADPDFCSKILSGHGNEVRPCLSCQYCFQTLDSGRSLRCTVNAETGREYLYPVVDKTNEPKNVTIIGGGPAGMEAARVAALRGHIATIIEKEEKLGGTLRAACVPPHKEKISQLIEWYESELKRLDVRIRTGRDVSKNLDEVKNQPYVLKAIGAKYIRRITGSEGGNILTATEALLNPSLVGERVVIIGGGVSGCETAEFLSDVKLDIRFAGIENVTGGLVYGVDRQSSGESVRKISVVEMLDDICPEMDEYNKPIMKISLKERDIDLLTGTMVKEITPEGVMTCDIKTGRERFIEADTVILAGGLESARIDIGDNVFLEDSSIGDSNKPGRIADAIYDGYIKARRL
jgi:2,4-dienoyl-CoA reductase-like NADH-dependent reductase (Old Yellow Enzyme family)/NADPH-dependent 2,4-dienoyl-CoA reductase/sulfur reductase-like enzyme